MRQRSTRYTIRAGRNLPDKEFRYLRTVIVTADIHGDFGSQLRPACAGLTAYHNLSALVTCHTLYVVFTTWQSAVFLLNSRLTHFTATPLHFEQWLKSRNPNFQRSKLQTKSVWDLAFWVLDIPCILLCAKYRGAPLLPKLRG